MKSFFEKAEKYTSHHDETSLECKVNTYERQLLTHGNS